MDQKPSSEARISGHFVRDEVRYLEGGRLRGRIKLGLSQDESVELPFEYIKCRTEEHYSGA